MYTYCNVALLYIPNASVSFYSFLELNLADTEWSPNFVRGALLNQGVLGLLCYAVKVKQSRYRPGVAQRVPGT
jgi:hypothetical protein